MIKQALLALLLSRRALDDAKRKVFELFAAALRAI